MRLGIRGSAGGYTNDMSIFENPFKKKVPAPERVEPQALNPERASQGEATDPNEP